MLFSMFVSEVTIWRKGRSCIEYLRDKDEVERAAGWSWLVTCDYM